MSKGKIGWHFPLSNGSEYDGFNNPGISHYTGVPFINLAREVIQNSLDAKGGEGRVEVHFVKEDVEVSRIPGIDDLRDAFVKCKKKAKARDSKSAQDFFGRGVDMLKGGKISCLKISDYNTTGARGDDDSGGWFALTRASGVGASKGPTSGGSFGIGKNAAYAVSDLRTVFYYTHYTKDGKPQERTRGKTILITHDNNAGKEKRGTGFYGYPESSLEKRDDIPEFLRRDIKRSRDEGTTVMVMGLKKPKNWRELIISAVISNFFYAIHKGNLEVCLDTDGELDSIIDSKTLPQLLEQPALQNNFPDVKKAHSYYLALTQGEQRDQTITGFKHCALWTKVGDGFPQGVAIVRKTGMVITDNMEGLQRWPGFDEFAAVCVCEDTDGNSLMRDMENPAHDAFYPDRLDELRGEGEAKKGRLAIRKLADWVRGIVKGFANIDEGKTDDIDELARYFHDITEGQDRLPGEEGERDFEGRSVCEMRRPPQPPEPPPPPPDEPSPSRPRRKSIPVESVRILPNPERPGDKNKRVRFTPTEGGNALLSLQVAGDVEMEDIAIESAAGHAVADGCVKMEVRAGERVMIDVVLAEETTDALRIGLFGDNTAKGRR